MKMCIPSSGKVLCKDSFIVMMQHVCFCNLLLKKSLILSFKCFYFFNDTVDGKSFPYHAGKHSTVIVIFLYWNYLMGTKFKSSH